MKEITSRANAGFRLLKDLVGSARERRKHSAAWLEGERLCLAYHHSGRQASALVISDSLDVDSLLALHGGKAKDIWVMHAALFREVTQLEATPGWGFVVDEPTAEPAFGPCDLVVFDRVQDPGNLGSMLRSAVAAGIKQAWSITGTVDPWAAKVLRAAMGAHFAIEIVTGVEQTDLIEHAKAHGVCLLATANRPNSVSLFSDELDLIKPCAWIFGQEGEGVSETLQASSLSVVIPQSKAIESLNVAAAASVCLFEMKRRRMS